MDLFSLLYAGTAQSVGSASILADRRAFVAAKHLLEQDRM